MEKSIKEMIEYMNKLEEVDTEGVDPLYQLFPNNNVFREDEITNENDMDNVMANAPEKEGNYFVVPKTFD